MHYTLTSVIIWWRPRAASLWRLFIALTLIYTNEVYQCDMQPLTGTWTLAVLIPDQVKNHDRDCVNAGRCQKTTCQCES